MNTHETKSPSNGAGLAAAKAAGARVGGKANGAAGGRREPVAAGNDAQTGDQSSGLSSGLIDPSIVLLPYLEVSRALLRAHHNALAMMEANRALADSLRTIVRRQQDLAFEIAEQAMAASKADAAEPSRDGRAPDAHDRDTVFHRAAEAVRELGEAVIAAQLNALDTLRDRARGVEGGRPLS